MKTLFKNSYYYLVRVICKKYHFSYAQKIPELTSAETVVVRQFFYSLYLSLILTIGVSFFLFLDELQSRQFGTSPFLHWYTAFFMSAIILLFDKANKNRNKLIHDEYSSNACAEYYIVFSAVLPPEEAKKMPIKDFMRSFYDYYEKNKITIKGKTFKCKDGVFCKIEDDKIVEIEYSSLSKYASDFRNGNLLK